MAKRKCASCGIKVTGKLKSCKINNCPLMQEQQSGSSITGDSYSFEDLKKSFKEEVKKLEANSLHNLPKADPWHYQNFNNGFPADDIPFC